MRIRAAPIPRKPGQTRFCLTILAIEKRHGKSTLLECLCSCGNTTRIVSNRFGVTKSCGCLHKKQQKRYVGETKNNLRIVKIIGSIKRNLLLKCLCLLCSNFTQIESNKFGKTKSCGCLPYNKTSSNSPVWTGYKQISGSLWTRYQRQARERNFSFTITIEEAWQQFEDQKNICALSGVPICLVMGRKLASNSTASLDRIDSSIGYVSGNIQWVHKRINKIKTNLPEHDFVRWCKKIVSYNKHAQENI